MQKPLTIGDLARETGVKVVTVRYYERIGLLPTPVRRGSGAYHIAATTARISGG